MLRHVFVVLAGVLGVGCAVLGLATGSASAASVHVFSGSFGASSSSPADPYPLNGPRSVAVNEATHDVYVVDAKNFRVEEFNGAGNFVSMFGKDVNKTKVEAAASEAEENVCAAATGDVCQAGVQGSGGDGQFSEPEYVAVDNSGGPSAGDVYVSDNGTKAVYEFDAAGAFISANTGLATMLGAFRHVTGIAVDASGNLWVSGESQVFEFEQGGGLIQETGEVPFPISGGIALDSFDDLYAVDQSSIVEYSATGGFIRFVVASTTGDPKGVAFDSASGDLYVDEGTSIEDIVSGSSVLSFGSPQLVGGADLAVDAGSGTVFAADASAGQVDNFSPVIEASTGAATAVTATSATVNATVNPEGSLVSDCHFEYGLSTGYGQSVPCEGPAVGSGTAPVAVHANLRGLQGGSTYHFRIVATNARATVDGEDRELTTPPPPSIGSATAVNVSGVSADLDARIDPNGFDTTYRFEWGTSIAYGTSVPIPDGDIGAGTSPVLVSAHLSGLSANTTYHWRVVATNENGTTAVGDQTFVYDTSGSGGLPDGRAYEMVTPPHKNAALLGQGQSGLASDQFDVAEDGSRVIMPAVSCFGGGGSCVSYRNNTLTEPYAFTRTGGGWVTTPLAPSATQFDANNSWKESAEGDTALFSMPTSPGREGSDHLYARGPDGSFLDIGPTAWPSLEPDEEAGFANGGSGGGIAVTADLSHVVFEQAGNSRVSLYEYVGLGDAAPMSVGVSGGAGSTDLISKCTTWLGNGEEEESSANALSADGETVFFTAKTCSSGSGANAGVPVPADTLYARIGGSRTVAISVHAPEPVCGAVCQGSPAGDARFHGASVDGSKVFFTSTQQLTDAASEDDQSSDSAFEGCYKTSGPNGCNLYEYDFDAPAGRNLIAVSAGDVSGGGPRVRNVAAVSADGSHVYFTADGVLSGANSQGQMPVDGGSNLYVFERDARYPEGHVAFIAETGVESKEANVTPDGRFLLFVSGGALTADDTSTTGASQVFRYDALTGELVRISIGERGFNDNGNAGKAGGGFFSSVGASIVNPFGTAERAVPVRRDPSMSNDGSYVFFESPVGLTPQALNEVPIEGSGLGSDNFAMNVYEWHEGHVYLISDGRDTTATQGASSVALLGTDASGADVFFTTADRLVAADTDTEMDVYDARICTAGEPCVTAPAAFAPCAGEACHGTPGAAPAAPVGATVTFSGPGNLAPPAPAVRPKASHKAKHKPRREAKPKKRRPKGRSARHGRGHTRARGK